MDSELILKYIRRDEQERKRRERMYNYYRNKHNILDRCMNDPTKPNNKLVHGYPNYIANAYTGYMFGEPVGYSAQDEALQMNVMDAFRYNDEQAENCALGLDLSICGVAVELHYLDKDAIARFKRVDPVGCIAVRDTSIEENLTELIRYYDVEELENNRTVRMVEVLDAQNWSVYRDETGGLVEIETKPHGYGDVPAVVYHNNADCMGDFEGQISLIDAYNLLQSEGINSEEYFNDAYLMLKGLMGTDDADIADMKAKRVLLMPMDSDAGFLTKQHDDAATENLKNRLNNDIHRFSGCPDMTDESFAGNASGVALKYKLLQFENIAGTKEREFKRGLQRRLELLCNIWNILGRGSFDWRDVQISFKRALPENLLELSQTLSNFGSILSDETKRGMIPMDIDEETEKQRLEEQTQRGMSLYSYNELQTGELTEEVFINAE